ncbi:MAG TPA: formylglycine-generating enzyme family protein, partial [Treponema sp.]|nr:formylglycine-generating enzyme family protein [Treponema sp.]
MGSPASEPERLTDETLHQVTLRAFYIAKSSMTQREYSRLMGSNPSEFKGETLPVENVTWFDAVRYCNARSAQEGLTPAYIITDKGDEISDVTWNRSADGYRLPTEAEWE